MRIIPHTDAIVFQSTVDAFKYHLKHLPVEITPQGTVMGLVVSAWRTVLGDKTKQFINVVIASNCGMERKVSEVLFCNIPKEGVPQEIRDLRGLLKDVVPCCEEVEDLGTGDFVFITVTYLLHKPDAFCVQGLVTGKASSPPELHGSTWRAASINPRQDTPISLLARS